MYKKDGTTGSYALPKALHTVTPNHPCVIQFIVMARANMRTPIAHVKTRGEVRVSGRKLYRQKGTGHARVGDAGSPIRRGGGVAFGPRNTRSYAQKMPKKMKKYALASSFVGAVESNKVCIWDYSADTIQTKSALASFNSLSVSGSSVLLISSSSLHALNMSLRNVPSITNKHYMYVSAYDLASASTIVIMTDVVDAFVERCI